MYCSNIKRFVPLMVAALAVGVVAALVAALAGSGSTAYAQTSPGYQIFLPQISPGHTSQSTTRQLDADEPTPAPAIGDVNCNGVVDSVDALFILQYSVGMRSRAEQCPLQNASEQLNVALADINGDDIIDAVDALMIVQCVSGLENSYCDVTPPASPHNVALGKSATQSSTMYGSNAPTHAVDGHTPTEYSIRATTQTKSEPYAWWQVDLGAIYDLHSIEIAHFTEGICCTEQQGLFVLISAQPFDSIQFEQTIAQEGVRAYSYGDIMELDGTGRYLRLQLNSPNRHSLVLGEIQVMGQLADGQSEPAFRSTFALGAGAYSTGLIRTEAFENGGRTALLRVSRPMAVHEVRVPLLFEGSSDPTRASASGDDYRLIEENGSQMSGNQLTLLPGQFERRIVVEALADGLVEVPEALRVRLPEHPSYDIVADASTLQLTLRDAEPGITANSRLLFGEMVPENNAHTTATGLATIQLSNDNSFGIVNTSFTQLSSVQIAAHIHAELPDGSNPSIFDLPLDQVVDRRWDIEAEATLATDQDVLDALFAGNLYINVHSSLHDEGEIRATLLNTQASLVMQPIPDPEPMEVLSDDDLKRDVVRFLTQATFGPTPDSVDDMMARINAEGGDRIAAYNKWITDQISLTSPSMLDYFNASRDMYLNNDDGTVRGKFSNIANGITPGWFAASVYGKSQLRERVGFALSEIFVVSIEDGALGIRPWAAADYYDMLRGNAFGEYEDLLTDVSRHPAMGIYLSHLKNRMRTLADDGTVRFSPDENYAREVMQLFSIGLVKLHRDGTLKLSTEGLPTRTYDQDDITDLARVFTGWNFDSATIPQPNNFNWIMYDTTQTDHHPYLWTPMTMWEDNGKQPTDSNYVRYHDDGAKTVLGFDIPAGQSGEDDLEDVMSILSGHENTAPFISYRLIQRLVMSNPSRGYIHRVATTFEESNGDLGEVVRAILLDPEARNLGQTNRVTYGKMKEPLVHLTNVMRLVRPQTELTSTHNIAELVEFGLPATEVAKYESDMELVTLNYKRFGRDNMGFFQAPLQAPSVFNWFLPSYAPPGAIAGSGLVAPELQHATESNTVAYYNVFHRLFLGNGLLGETPEAGLGTPYVNTKYNKTKTHEWLGDIYISTLDEQAGDGIVAGNPAYTNPTSVRQAIAAMVDTVDLYVCAGRLQFNATGSLSNDPREIIITGIQDAWDNYDGTSNVGHVALARDERIKDALLLVSAAPPCMIQR